MKKISLSVSVLVLALGIAVSGCSKGSDSAVLAKVNGTSITVADFKKQLEELNPQLRQAVAMDPAARKEFLENQILTELLVQEAKKQGLDKEDAYKKNIESRSKEYEDQKKQLDKQYEDAKKRLDQERQNASKLELIQSVLKKGIGDKVSQMPAPTDKEVRNYYNTNKDRIRAAFGKQVSLKEIEPQIKGVLVQEKQSRLSLEYAKGLKAKATISSDDKALETAMAELTRPPAPPEVPKAPAVKEGSK